MTLRPIIFRLILWSLGLSAVIGAAAVLTGGGDVILRILVTAIFTSGAAILLYLMSILIDRETLRPAGLFGMCLVIVEYLGILALTWYFFHTTHDDEVFITLLVLGFPGLAAFAFLLFHAKPATRIAARFGVATAGVVAVMFLIANRAPSTYAINSNTWDAPWPIAAYGLLTAITLVGYGDKHHWRWLGIACAIAATVVAEYGIWFDVPDSHVGRTLLSGLSVAACAVAHANLVIRAPLRPGQRWLAAATIAAGVATAALLFALVALDVKRYDDHYLVRSAGATAVAAACGSLALLVLARFNRGINVEPGSTDFSSIDLTCPRCRRKQTIPLGGGRCGACDLRIDVTVEEPRCTSCGYLLYNLTGDACPECGTTIART